MADPKVMDMVTMDVLDSDGFTALYGVGELHELGSLPAGVAFKTVVADDAMLASANPHAQQPKPKPAKAEEPKGEAKSSKS